MSYEAHQARVNEALETALEMNEQLARLDGTVATDDDIKGVILFAFYKMDAFRPEWSGVVEAVVRRFPNRQVVLDTLFSRGNGSVRFADVLAEVTTENSMLVPMVMRWHRFDNKGVERAMFKISESEEIKNLCKPGDELIATKKMLRELVTANRIARSDISGDDNRGRGWSTSVILTTIERFIDNQFVGGELAAFVSSTFRRADVRRIRCAVGPAAISAAQQVLRDAKHTAYVAIKATSSADRALDIVEQLSEAESAEGKRAAWVGAKLAAGRFPESEEIAEVVSVLTADRHQRSAVPSSLGKGLALDMA